MRNIYHLLSDVSSYNTERFNPICREEYNYISTENMLENKNGVAFNLYYPVLGSVRSFIKNDILISNIRPYFKKIWFADRVGGCSDDILVIRAKNIYPKFLYYVLCDNNFFNYSTVTAKGTKMPRGSKDAIMKYLVPNVPIHIQEKIADILSTYDDLIENNNRRIEILEQMAQEIYKEWFVRFRFPGHEKVKFINGLPEGWEVKKIKDIVDRKPFGTLYKESQVKEYGKVIVIDQSKKDYIGFHNNEPSHNADIEKPMILFGDHSCKYKIMIKPFSLAENVIPFISNDENLLTTYYLFYSINGIVQTTEYKRHWTDLTNKKIIISNINLQTKFEEKIKEFLLEIEQLSIINRNLIKQRDLLLPRLMSGKLEV